jgi:general secretion pathway protein G
MSEAQKKKILGLAIASLICGCFSIVPLVGIILGVVAVILGIIALVKISNNKEALRGSGLAITGIVLGIIAWIMTIFAAVTIMPQRLALQRVSVAKIDILKIDNVLNLYELDYGSFPSSAEGLDALLVKPSGWGGSYLEKMPLDPWGREYKYRYPGNHKEEYDLYSLGADGVESNDDITNWE